MTSATFSPELEFGDTAFAELGGLTIAQFGAGLAPANLSARQAAGLGLLTSGTCGPRGITSSRSAALQESLASKLQAKTGSSGSILYRLTWKTRVTPSGRPICALRGSPNKGATVADFICGNGNISSPLTGWPTPAASDGERGGTGITEGMTGRSLPQMARMATGWNTPVTNDAEKRGVVDPMRGNGLSGQANLAGWNTPTCNIKDQPDDSRRGLQTLTGQAKMASWPTPNAGDQKWRASNAEITERRRAAGRQVSLEGMAMLATVPNDCTAFLIMTPDGQTQTSFIAATGGGVQLNPAHSRWLMRFPVQWEQCAPNYEPYALLQALASAT